MWQPVTVSGFSANVFILLPDRIVGIGIELASYRHRPKQRVYRELFVFICSPLMGLSFDNLFLIKEIGDCLVWDLCTAKSRGMFHCPALIVYLSG